MKVNFETKVVTVIFKDGQTATFERCVMCNKRQTCIEIFFIIEGIGTNINYTNYTLDEVATVVNGYVDILDGFGTL